MDRNKGFEVQARPNHVALRKESVDRNEKFEGVIAIKEYVALRKESVDRNRISLP